MVYPGKRDWWIAGILAVVIAGFLVLGGTLIGIALVEGVWPALVPGSILPLTAGLLLWVLQATNYEITETSLVVRSGPLRWAVPLDAIEEVVPGEQWYGGPEWGFSLALRGLRLRYRKRNGRLTWPIRIAPQDQAAFLLDLAGRLPGLVVKDDGSLRRPAGPDGTG